MAEVPIYPVAEVEKGVSRLCIQDQLPQTIQTHEIQEHHQANSFQEDRSKSIQEHRTQSLHKKYQSNSIPEHESNTELIPCSIPDELSDSPTVVDKVSQAVSESDGSPGRCIDYYVKNGDHRSARRYFKKLSAKGRLSSFDFHIQGDPSLPSLLSVAAGAGDLEMCEILVNNGADVNQVGNTLTAIEILFCSNNASPENVQWFLKHGAHPRLCVSFASTMGLKETLAVLLRNGADPNQGQMFGRSPLLSACYGKHLKCISLLLDYGADPSLILESPAFRDIEGKSSSEDSSSLDLPHSPFEHALLETFPLPLCRRLFRRSLLTDALIRPRAPSLAVLIMATRNLHHVRLFLETGVVLHMSPANKDAMLTEMFGCKDKSNNEQRQHSGAWQGGKGLVGLPPTLNKSGPLTGRHITRKAKKRMKFGWIYHCRAALWTSYYAMDFAPWDHFGKTRSRLPEPVLKNVFTLKHISRRAPCSFRDAVVTPSLRGAPRSVPLARREDAAE
ncbi:unnamed protein product [Cyprideis torosa]|uniref:Uncharacterized protein n=1 Tax=Cyprideis torosa TaxID=163714 RepID=A0A7R8WAE2_9CRUS|nr:unnamed protein product [Cyprideis torosa]CAG0885783.1 unnamed protein product [Cyprideis torosa]